MSTLASIRSWLDPNATGRLRTTAGDGPQAAPPPVWSQYLVFSAGVFASPLIRHYRALGEWPHLGSARVLGALIFSLLTGFILFPRVIDSLAKPEASWLSRLSTIFTAGVGWEQLSGLPDVFTP